MTNAEHDRRWHVACSQEFLDPLQHSLTSWIRLREPARQGRSSMTNAVENTTGGGIHLASTNASASARAGRLEVSRD